jgi:drug/metabolite transporter (DMT)-like permease
LLLQPTLSFAWDIIFFGRALTAIEAVGAVIALMAIFLGSRQSSQQT